jgi:hypothetical protein
MLRAKKVTPFGAPAASGAPPRRKSTGFAALFLASGACAMSNGDASANNSASSVDASVTVVGRLTDEGVECQALRGDDGQLYTLLGGGLSGLPVETRVRVIGERLEFSSCQQGITIRVQSISPADPRGNS